MRVRARARVRRSFAVCSIPARPDSGVTYLLKFYGSREIETTPARTARLSAFARTRRRRGLAGRRGERSDPWIKRRLTIVHSVSRHHRVSSAAAGRCTMHRDAVPGNLRPSSEKRAWNPVEPPRWLLIVIINGIMT